MDQKELAPIDVAIISDVRLLRDGLRDSLGKYAQLRIVGAVEPSTASAIVEWRPHVALLDIAMTGALGFVRLWRDSLPQMRVVALSMTETEQTIITCAEAGVHGYICRDGSVADVVDSIERACRDELHVSPRIAASMFKRLASIADARQATTQPFPLTPREREIVSCLDRGLSNKEIARTLGIEVATVKNHVHNVLEKLSATGRGEAAARVRAALGAAVPDLSVHPPSASTAR